MNLVVSQKLRLIILVIGVSCIISALVLLMVSLPFSSFVVVLGATALVALAVVINLETLLLFITVVCIPCIIDFRIYYNAPLEIVINLQHISVLAMFLVWLTSPRSQSVSVYRPHPVIFLLIISLVWDMITLSVAPVPLLGFSQILLRGLGFALYFYIIHRSTSIQAIERIATYVTISILIQSCIAILQQLYHGSIGIAFLGETKAFDFVYGSDIVVRSSGTTGHPNWLGNFLAMTLLIPVALTYTTNKLWLRLLSIASLFLGFIGLIVTLSRASWLAFAGAAATTSILFLLNMPPERLRRIIRYGILVFITFAIAVAILFPTIQQRLIGSDEGSAASRLPLFDIAFELIETHPIFGVGLANYREMLDPYAPATSWEGAVYVHNTFLLIWAETGLVGVVLFITILLILMKIALRAARSSNIKISSYGAVVLGAFVAFVIGNQFGSEYESFTIIMTLWLMIALAHNLGKLAQAEVSSGYEINASI